MCIRLGEFLLGEFAPSFLNHVLRHETLDAHVNW